MSKIFEGRTFVPIAIGTCPRYKEKSVITKGLRFFLSLWSRAHTHSCNAFSQSENGEHVGLSLNSAKVAKQELNLLQMETGPYAPIDAQKTFVCNRAIVINLIKQDLIN